MIRLALSLAAVFGLLHVAGTTDVLSDVTRPLVGAVLNAIGVPAVDQQEALRVGRLIVPWTRDCAGLNVLAMLWAVILWTNRAQPLSRRVWVQFLLAVPVAFLANVARILTLIAFRTLFYPAVESPQLHYFIGFLWVMPSLGLWVPWRGGPARGRYVEVLYLAAILALLAPHVGGPGGSLAALAALVVLAQGRFGRHVSTPPIAAATAWLASGAFVGVAGMESLWVPWMLACPWFVGPRIPSSWSGIVLLSGTVPVLAMHPIGSVAVAAALAWSAWRLVRISDPPVPPGSVSAPEPRWRPALAAALAFTFLSPFVAAAVSRGGPSQAPPPGTMARRLDATSYSVRLVGQSPDIELAWFEASGDGRHHTLPVCLRFRGVVVTATTRDGVMTDGERWMREYFLHEGALVGDYATYLRRTLLPFSSAGIHIIVSAPVTAMSAPNFANTADELARELDQLARFGQVGCDPPLTTRAARSGA